MRGKRYGPGGVRALGGGDASGMCTGRAQLKAGGVRARAERTVNMYCVFGALDMSKLSAWLNLCAPCRESKGGHAVRGEVCRPESRGARARGAVAGASGVHVEDQRLGGWGGRARAERTVNMYFMLVTPEVSKLSGWLNADASCRVERRACDA